MKLLECEQPLEILEALKEFAKRPRGFLLLAGKNGTGKTYAAKAIYQDFRPSWDNFVTNEKCFTTQADMNITWQKTVSEWNDSSHLLTQFVYPELLILDDLGTRTPSESFMDFLYVIADKRYVNKNRCGTVITTNMNSTDMRAKFGDAFVSRIASGKCFRLEGDDRRFKEF